MVNRKKKDNKNRERALKAWDTMRKRGYKKKETNIPINLKRENS